MMSNWTSTCMTVGLLCAGMALLPVVGADAASAPSAIPDFSSKGVSWSGYVALPVPTEAHGRTFNDFTSPASGPGPVTDDPAHPFVNNEVSRITGKQPTFRVANVNNPNLKPWIIEELRKANAKALSGAAAYSREARCWATGVPAFHLNPGQMYIVQTPKQVLLFLAGRVRRVHLNVPHSPNPKSSWYGESVGYYENGDTLVVDTVGFNDKTYVDSYRTPHTTQLHVVERFKLTTAAARWKCPSRSRIRAPSTHLGRARETVDACSVVRSRKTFAPKTPRTSSITRSNRCRRPNGRTSRVKEKGPEQRPGPFL